MRRVAIIQARMGSSRLSGKSLMPLAGKPVLWHVIHRLRRCRTLDAIALATSTSSTDDPLEQFARSEGIEVIRGPEDDVLARYFMAARKLDADIIVRITGDAPLIDPVMIDRLVENLIAEDADYCIADPQTPCIHEGFEPFTFRSLSKLIDEASDDPSAKEHVTAYFKKHPEFVRVRYVPVEADYQFAGARISVDTPVDLEFLETVYRRLGVEAGEADVRDVVRLLRREPELLRINSHVYQKKADERSLKILFRCDGDAQIGLGHIYRSLALADSLREDFGCGVTFAVSTGDEGIDLIKRAGYRVERNETGSEEIWLDSVIKRFRPDATVFDIRTNLSRASLERWRSEGMLTVVIDDASGRRLAADIAFYPPVPQVRRLSWEGQSGDSFAGWEWVLLRREFARARVRPRHSRPLLLVTMGGSDPAGLTMKAVEALNMLDDNFDTTIVLGAGFTHHDELKSLLDRSPRRYDVKRDVADMAELMGEADMAVASFGVTAYEMAVLGVPAIYVCLTGDHAESASLFVDEGIALSLGLHERVSAQPLAECVKSLLTDEARRREMSVRARYLVDGRGVERIAGAITDKLKSLSAIAMGVRR